MGQHKRDIRLLVEAGISHMEISRYIMNMNPGVRRGLSERSVRRFCSELDIHFRSRLNTYQLEADDELDLSQELVKFCISYIVLHVCRNALLQFVTTWNFHRIMGRNGGIPNLLAGNNRTTTLPNHVIPETSSVIATYTSSGNGRLTAPHSFGTDPLIQHPPLRERYFSNHFPNMDILFESVT